jgi:hypothetical protein
MQPKKSVSAANQRGDKTNLMSSGMRNKMAFQSRETLKVSLMAAKIKSGTLIVEISKNLKVKLVIFFSRYFSTYHGTGNQESVLLLSRSFSKNFNDLNFFLILP